MALLTAVAAIPCCAARFGKLPGGGRLDRIKASPNYVDGEFRNLERTEMASEGKGRFSNTWDYLFKKWERRTPPRGAADGQDRSQAAGQTAGLHRLAGALFVSHAIGRQANSEIPGKAFSPGGRQLKRNNRPCSAWDLRLCRLGRGKLSERHGQGAHGSQPARSFLYTVLRATPNARAARAMLPSQAATAS